MRSTIVAIMLSGVFLVSNAGGQTTGVPFLNDYTITCTGCATGAPVCFPPGAFGGAGGTSGSTSCTTLFFDLSAGGTLTFSVSCVPGAPVTIFINPCPCFPCFLPLPPVCGIPFTACGATTNLSVDLDLTCTLTTLFSGFGNTAGVFSVTLPIPPLPPGFCLRLSSQALILGSISCAPPPLVSQAYNIVIGA